MFFYYVQVLISLKNIYNTILCAGYYNVYCY